MKWKDATSYSRDERGKVEPRVWEVEIAGLRISVHRYHELDGWFLSCHAMGVERKELAATSIESAQNEALIILRGMAKRWADKLAAALETK